MTVQEKVLYHQIHPLKLATDWGSTPLALYFFWRHRIITGLIVTFAPAILVSMILIRFFNLESYKRSRFGHYVRQNMTPAMQALRLTGFVVMALGACFHRVWLLPLGLGITLFAWLRGLLFPGRS